MSEIPEKCPFCDRLIRNYGTLPRVFENNGYYCKTVTCGVKIFTKEKKEKKEKIKKLSKY